MDGHEGGGMEISIRITRVPFFPRTGNDLPAWSARPTGLRGHGHGRCDSDPRVLFGGRRADKPLKGPVSPSSKVYQLLPGYTSRTTTTAAAAATHIGRNTSTPPLYLYSNHSGPRSRAFCTSLSTLISAPFTSPR